MRPVDYASLLATIILQASAIRAARAQSVDPCALVTKAEAAQILAKPAIAKAQTIPGDDTCGFLGAGFDVHTEPLKSVSGWSAMLKKMIQEKKAERVDKIGDEAAFLIDPTGDYSMIARKGSRTVTIAIFKANSTLAEAKPHLAKLITVAVNRLP